MIIWKDGKVDNRRVLKDARIQNTGTHSVIVANGDGTFEEVYLSLYESIGGWDDTIEGDDFACSWEYDGTKQDLCDYYSYVFNKKFLGQSGLLARKGFVMEVIKGRKYQKGLSFKVNAIKEYVIAGTYGHGRITYLYGNASNGDFIKIDALNTIIKGIGDYDISYIDR